MPIGLPGTGIQEHTGKGRGTTQGLVSLDQSPSPVLVLHAQELQREKEEATPASDGAVRRAGTQLRDGAARSHTALMSDASISTAGPLPCPLTAAPMRISPEP